MAAKHSPGPWGAGAALSSDAYHIRYISDAEGDQVAEVSSGFSHVNPARFDQDTALANARLIAAAPELLEALESCLGRLEWLNDPRSGNTETPWIKQAQKAVNKAKGNT